MAKCHSDLTYEDLPEEVISFAKLCILGNFGFSLAGATKPPIQMICETINELGGNP